LRQAGEGEVTSHKMAGKLTEILEGIEKVSGIVNEISASAKEQSAGVDRINRAVADMNKVTQQNAANSEESSSAAVELSSQAEEVAAMVSSFQLSRTRGLPTRAGADVPTVAKVSAQRQWTVALRRSSRTSSSPLMVIPPFVISSSRPAVGSSPLHCRLSHSDNL